MRRSFILLLAGITPIFSARSLRAEEFTHRSFALPEGKFEVTGEPARPKILGVGMSKNHPGDPIYIAPHFYWGVTNSLTLGITHERACALRTPSTNPSKVRPPFATAVLASTTT